MHPDEPTPETADIAGFELPPDDAPEQPGAEEELAAEAPKPKRGRRPSAKKAVVAAEPESECEPEQVTTETSLTKIPSKHRKFAKGL